MSKTYFIHTNNISHIKTFFQIFKNCANSILVFAGLFCSRPEQIDQTFSKNAAPRGWGDVDRNSWESRSSSQLVQVLVSCLSLCLAAMARVGDVTSHNTSAAAAVSLAQFKVKRGKQRRPETLVS